MSVKYDEIVPWGRSYEEYCRMFDLTAVDFEKRILGCGDGPASFNAIGTSQGSSIVSIDPIYELSRDRIAARIDATFDTVISQTRNNREKFVWTRIRTPEELGEVRMAAMREFLADYDAGKAAGRYVAGSLPKIAFPDNSFDLVLCAYLLFFYSANTTFEFHVASIQEMLRVAREVRIFPLVDLNAQKSMYLDDVIARFASNDIEIRNVDYEFQVGGNEMMVITRKPGGVGVASGIGIE